MLFACRAGISPDTFDGCEALSCRFVMAGKMVREQLSDEGSNAPLFLLR
jgi:hypothetical protein